MIFTNQQIAIHEHAEILTIRWQGERPVLWAMVPIASILTKSQTKRSFIIYGTGDPFDDFGLKYIGTCFDDKLSEVWHIFEATI